MPKVIHIINGLDGGGAERMLARLLASSGDHKMDHVVVSLMDEGLFGETIRAAGIPLHCLGIGRRRISIRAFGRLIRLLRSERPDVVQTWLYHSDLAGLLALPLMRPHPVLVWNLRCSDMPVWRDSILTASIRHLLAWCSMLPAAVIANSRKGLAAHERFGYRPRRWVKIPNGFDLDELRPDPAARATLRRELGIPEDSFVFGLVARLDPMKDHARFVEAVRQVVRTGKGESAYFVLVGEGVVATALPFAEAAQDSALAGRMRFLGLRRDIARIMTALDALVLCSAYGEGFPNVVGEAMACGVSCIVTEVGDAADIVSTTGTVIPPRDTGALVAAMAERLTWSREQMLQRGAAARERIAQNYSIQAVRSSYENLYSELLDTRRASGRTANAKKPAG